ncbi:hypothetical protein L4C42_14615 [Vibrio wakamikoensis]|uniref:Secreted protein n=1 Tax=Vibrio chaetopteri TaxID=3016528 RepID=A0AAU8BGM4_9VIBR
MKYIKALLLGGVLAFSLPSAAYQSSAAGPFVDCQLPDGSRTFVPLVVCQRAGGEKLF